MVVFSHTEPRFAIMQETADNNKTEKNTKSNLLAKRRLVFKGFEFYPAKLLLTYRDTPCNLEPKMLQLLSLLIEARPEVLSKQQLMQELWPDAIVSDWSLARLVSDTRKLIEDDGQQQSIIKTVRGKGFAFAAPVDEIIEAYPQQKTSIDDRTISEKYENKSKFQQSRDRRKWASPRFGLWLYRVFSTILLAFGIIAGYQLLSNNSASIPLNSVNHKADGHYLYIMLQIQKNLRLTKTTYQVQSRRRKELRTSLLLKSPEETPLSSEKWMRLHFANLTKDEKFIFDQIRALTEGPMYQGNTAILNLLDEHPEIYREIEIFVDLYNHLNIWQNKYHRVFENRPDMSFVFVGEEDGVPFPSEVDGLVDQWIEVHSAEKSTLSNSNSQ